MSCDQIEIEITAIFNKIKSEANGGNITDEMVIKTGFNDLKERARVECNDIYSIEWGDKGHYLKKSTA